MNNLEILHNYQTKGIEVDPTDYLDENGNNIEPTRSRKYSEARWSGAEAVFTALGDKLSDTDLPSGMRPMTRSALLGSFTEQEQQAAARLALYHEATPPALYWREAANTLFPKITPDRSRMLSRDVSCDDVTHGILSDVSTLLSRRSRGQSDLRGDTESLEAFAAPLTSPDLNLPPNIRCELLSHFIAHSRIQHRAKSRFNDLAQSLPDEAAAVCKTIRSGNLEPEILEHHAYLSKMGPAEFNRHHKMAQNDVLDVAKARLASRIPGAPSRSGEAMSHARTKVALTRKLVSEAQEAGALSEATSRANRQIFTLSGMTASADICLVAPEISRQERMRQQERAQEVHRGSSQLEL